MLGQRLAFILRRVLQAIPILFAIIVINFLLLKLAPGDAVDVLAGEAGSATPEYMAELRAKFGLDQPIPVQLANYVARVAVGDFGWSFRHEMPVTDLIMQRLVPTLLLMGATILIAVGVGAFLGLLAATGLNTWRDNVISVLALVSYATPLFWVGLMLILVFSVQLGWFPTSGMETIAAFHTGWDRVLDIAHHLVLPALTLWSRRAWTMSSPRAPRGSRSGASCGAMWCATRSCRW